MLDGSLKKAKRLLIAFMGFSVLAVGIAMIVLPGPALVVIPAALGILATEFAWAKSLLNRIRQRIVRDQYQKEAESTTSTSENKREIPPS